jgi:hypothetical protein
VRDETNALMRAPLEGENPRGSRFDSVCQPSAQEIAAAR